MATPPMVPAGWYADPARRHEYRYWDGATWTAGVADGGITATDPLEAPPSPVLGPAPVQQAEPVQAAQQAQAFQQQPASAQQAQPVDDPPVWHAQASPGQASAAQAAQPVEDPPVWHAQASPGQPVDDPPVWHAQASPGQAVPGQPAEQAPPPWQAQAFPAQAPFEQAPPIWQGSAPAAPSAPQTGPLPRIQMQQAAPGQAMPTPPPPGELWPGAATGAAPPPAPPRRRRRGLLFSGIAGVVVLALVIGLVIWAPWKVPPLLKPTGLKAGTVTVSSIALHWSNPPSGPDPDKYLILHNGKVIGSVPGTVTTYQTSGLAPDTPYQYRVVAERGGKRSAQSALLVVHTAIPPVSAARWDGLWTVKVKIVKGQSTINGAKKWTESWLATPKCTTGPCTVRLSVALNGHNFKVTLSRSGAVYAGKASTHVFPCGSGANSFPIKSSLDIKITVGSADVVSGAWKASSWAGTMVIHSPYTAKGNFYCPASSQTAKLSSVGI
jgi:hypothetical protein